MQSRIDIDAERRLCTVRIRGLATAAKLAQAFFRAFDSPDWDRGYNLMIVYEADALLGELTLRVTPTRGEGVCAEDDV